MEPIEGAHCCVFATLLLTLMPEKKSPLLWSRAAPSELVLGGRGGRGDRQAGWQCDLTSPHVTTL